MSEQDHYVGDMLLQDFVEGRLDPATAARMKEVLAGAPDLQRRAVEHLALAHRLRQHFAVYDKTPLPPEIEALGRRLRSALIARRRMDRVPRLAGWAVAASVAVMLCGVGWYATGPGGPLPFAALNTVLSAPKDGPSALALAATTPSSGAPASAPDFADLGFKLLETRTIGRGDLDAVQLVYESDDGARVSLYYSDIADGTAPRVAVREEGALSMLFWQDGTRAFSMIGEVDRDTLLKLGRAVSGRSPFDAMPGRTAPESSVPERRTERDHGMPGSAV